MSPKISLKQSMSSANMFSCTYGTTLNLASEFSLKSSWTNPPPTNPPASYSCTNFSKLTHKLLLISRMFYQITHKLLPIAQMFSQLNHNIIPLDVRGTHNTEVLGRVQRTGLTRTTVFSFLAELTGAVRHSERLYNHSHVCWYPVSTEVHVGNIPEDHKCTEDSNPVERHYTGVVVTCTRVESRNRYK